MAKVGYVVTTVNDQVFLVFTDQNDVVWRIQSRTLCEKNTRKATKILFEIFEQYGNQENQTVVDFSEGEKLHTKVKTLENPKNIFWIHCKF